MYAHELREKMNSLSLEQLAEEAPINPYGPDNPVGSSEFAQAAKEFNSRIAYAKSEVRRANRSTE